MNRKEELQSEQRAFEADLDSFLVEHAGEFVAIADQQPLGFFPTYQAAHRAGLERFGLSRAFLVSEVRKGKRTSTANTWKAGIGSDVNS